jgi:class 3 adenylate cyclase
MEPQVQYAKTSDGVNIAYSTEGDGPTLLIMPLIPWSHLERDRDLPFWGSFAEPAGGLSRTVVRYDNRGSGLSDHEAPDYSLDGHVRDLEAVSDAMRAERIVLAARAHSGPVAITYAVQHPDRVSHLVLVASHASGAEYVRAPQFQALQGLMEADWDLFAETAARNAMGFSDEATSRAWAKVFRESTTSEVARKIYDGIANVDVSDILGEVRAPTLVVRTEGMVAQPVERARQLAAGIPGARLVTSDGWRETPALIREFLGDEPPSSQQSALPDAPAVHTILFTDVEGSTALIQRLGDEKGREVLREHERITRGVLAAHGGAEVKTMGDGFMASFGSVTRAVECAIALQQAFADREGEPLSVRVGLNAGEPIEEEGDLFGATVILASRIAAKADGGEILVSDNVRSLCSGKGFLFADRGEFVAKGFEEPVRVYEVRWRA